MLVVKNVNISHFHCLPPNSDISTKHGLTTIHDTVFHLSKGYETNQANADHYTHLTFELNNSHQLSNKA